MDQDELRALEDQCIQEHAPECTATCPIHVDARGICIEIAKGDFATGLKIFRKTAPFPGILSQLCDQPCQTTCLRKDIGGAIELRKLEQALMNFGGAVEHPRPLPAKPRNVAVIGAGMSGLTVAYDLAKKGYQVVIFEKEPVPGGIINEVPEDFLSQKTISDDLQVLSTFKVDLRCSTEIEDFNLIDNHQFEINGDLFDTVFVGIGKNGVLPQPLISDDDVLSVDPRTFETKIPGVFAAGSMLAGTPVIILDAKVELPHSIIQSMAQGRKAALSMDRYLQKVSLTAARKNEGSYKTRLFTNIERYESQPVIFPADPSGIYQNTEAIQEAQRCIQCECMECVKDCVFLQEYGSYPKRYLREIYNNLSIVSGTRGKNQMINSCSLCGLCAEICPEDLNMADVCLEARRTMVTQKRMPPSAHDFALQDMQFSNSDHFSMIRHQPGTAASGVLFFPGCQLCASSPEDVETLYKLLIKNFQSKAGEGIGLALGCCGAPAEWAGQEDLFQTTQKKFFESYQSIGTPLLLVACSSCFHIFKKYYPDLKLKSLWVYLDELDIKLPDLSEKRMALSIQDPCTTRYEREIQDSVRQLIEKTGIQIEELPLNREHTECCSYGGNMWVANRDLAKKVVERRINQSSLDYITYCAMCRDFFAKSGKGTLHLLDLLFHSDSLTERKLKAAPDFSFRHENRARLKNKLKKTLWGEMIMEPEPYEKIKLILTDDVRKRMEDRMILVEDVQKVIEYAERTHNKLQNSTSGNFLAHYCPASVTYWVEYQPAEGGFEVFTAYCHRMTIEDEVKE